MKIYPKQSKGAEYSYYYGNYGEIPAGISVVTIDEFNQTFTDTKHYHEEAVEFYVVTQGKILVEVNGKDVEVDAENMLMVEPQEPHYVKSILSFPCTWISFATPKGETSDKVNL